MRKITDKEYFAHAAINRSFLWEIHERSVLHALASKEEPEKETAALSFGKAVHAVLLEPEVFAKRYARFPGLNRRLKAHQEKIKELADKGIEILDDEDFARVMTIRENIYAHPTASWLMAPDQGESELGFFWCDEDTGLECKIKVDRLRKDNIVVDLKTAADAGDRFRRVAFDHGYHMQAAFYWDGLKANGIEPEGFVFVVVESEKPHDIVIYQAGEDMINLGRAQYKAALKMYKESLENGAKGYSSKIELLRPPAYLMKAKEL